MFRSQLSSHLRQCEQVCGAVGVQKHSFLHQSCFFYFFFGGEYKYKYIYIYKGRGGARVGSDLLLKNSTMPNFSARCRSSWSPETRFSVSILFVFLFFFGGVVCNVAVWPVWGWGRFRDI